MSVIVAKHIVSYLFSTCVLASPITLVLMGGGTSWLGSSGNSSIAEEIQDIEIQTPKKTTAKNQHLQIANNTFSTHAASTYTPQKITEELKIKQNELEDLRQKHRTAWNNVKIIHNSGHNEGGYYNYIQDADNSTWYNHNYSLEITPRFRISHRVTKKSIYTLWQSEGVRFGHVNTTRAARMKLENIDNSNFHKGVQWTVAGDSHTFGMYLYYRLSMVNLRGTFISGFENILRRFREEAREALRYATLITSKKKEIASFIQTHSSPIPQSSQQ